MKRTDRWQGNYFHYIPFGGFLRSFTGDWGREWEWESWHTGHYPVPRVKTSLNRGTKSPRHFKGKGPEVLYERSGFRLVGKGEVNCKVLINHWGEVLINHWLHLVKSILVLHSFFVELTCQKVTYQFQKLLWNRERAWQILSLQGLVLVSCGCISGLPILQSCPRSINLFPASTPSEAYYWFWGLSHYLNNPWVVRNSKISWTLEWMVDGKFFL